MNKKRSHQKNNNSPTHVRTWYYTTTSSVGGKTMTKKTIAMTILGLIGLAAGFIATNIEQIKKLIEGLL